MLVREAARQLETLYPRIYFACHTRHVADPKTRRLLSAHQASILDHLDERELTSVSGLAAHMGVTASTMSLSLDRLVDRGYLTRRRDPRDARRVLLRLTPAGLRIREAKSVLDAGRVQAMLKHLSPGQRAEAMRGLGLLAWAAQQEMHNKPLYGLRGRSRHAGGTGRRGSRRAGASSSSGRVRASHEEGDYVDRAPSGRVGDD